MRGHSIVVLNRRFAEIIEIMCMCRGVIIHQSEFSPNPDRQTIYYESTEHGNQLLMVYINSTMEGFKGIEIES